MQQENLSLEELKQEQIAKIEHRNQNGILEKENANFLIKLIKEAQNKSDVLKLSSLGMALKRTGFHFDVRLEKEDRTIKYFAKNENLSFKGKNALTHKLIIGDNYPALLNLLITHKGKIKVIYIDPPYGKDDLGDFAKTNYDNAITRDNLLSMLKPRLELARMLLRDDGVIFCSIDDKNQAYVKCLFDEVFGEREFVCNFIWKGRTSKQYDSITTSIQTDYILCYGKNKDNLSFNKIWGENDGLGYKNLDNDPKGAWITSGLIRDDGRKKYKIITPSGKEYYEAWLYTEENMNKFRENGELWFGINGDAKPRKKSYLKDFEGNITSNLLIGSEVGTNEQGTNEIKKLFDNKLVFDHPKPTSLIKHLLKISTNKPDFDSTNRGGGIAS